MDSVKKTISPIEAAQILGVCRKTVYTMLKNNEIPHIKCGDLWVIPVPAFEKWMLECGNKIKVGTSV